MANALICVPASQKAEYARFHPPEVLVTHPDSVVGLCAKRQWAYDRWGDVFQLDDDSFGLFRIYRPAGKRIEVRPEITSPRRAWELIQLAGHTARQTGAHLFGFASHAHPLTYNQFRPFKRGGYSPGGAMGLLRGSRLFWPQSTAPIDDDWICLLNAFHHRYAWYDGRFAFGFRETYRGAGGMSEFRARPGSTEKDATVYLVRAFGEAVVPKKPRGSGATKRQRNEWARRIELPYRT